MPIYILFPLFASASIGFLCMNFPPLTSQFMNLYQVEYSGLALLFSAFFWTHALFQIPAGFIVDKVGPYKITIIAILMAIVFNTIPILKPESLLLSTIMRLLLGLSSSLLFLSIVKTIEILIPKEKIPLAQGLQGGFFSAGLLVPYLILPLLGENAWFYSFIIPTIILSLLFLFIFLLPKEKLNITKKKTVKNSANLKILKTLMKNKIIWITGIAHGIFYGSINNLGNWMPSIISDRSLEAAKWGTLATSLVLLAGALSRSFGSYLLKYSSQEKLIIISTLLTGVLYFTLAIPSSSYLALLIAIIMAITCGFSYGSLFAITSRAFPLYVATAIGFMNMIANLSSSAITILLGTMRERNGSFTIGLMVVGLVCLIFLAFYKKRKRFN